MTHQCGKCESSFSTKSNLRKHVKKFHPEDVSKLAPLHYQKNSNSPSSEIRCNICGKTFNHMQSLRRHKKTHISDPSSIQRLQSETRGETIKSLKKCPLCDYSACFKKELLDHFKNFHEIPLHWHKLNFSSMTEFNQWKEQTENQTNSKFIKKSAETFQSHKSFQYACHRSGNYFPEGKGLRHLKTKGSCKINAYCPATIKAVIENAGNIDVNYLESHVGHDLDIGHLHLTKLEQGSIASKIAAKIPFDEILDGIRDSITDNALKRIHLLTKKDLFNIENSYNLCSSSVLHPNDAVSVESWVIEMQRVGECVLFYKPQGVISEEYPHLKQEDFVLIIMTPAQAAILKKFGSDCICLDGTHGLNSYNFELHTLLVIDDLREGFPCAFFMSNRSDTYVINLFLSQVAKNVGIITPKTFMSDLTEIYFNAWCQVMGIPEKRLFCTWHLDRAWRKNLSKIKNQEKKELMYKELRTMLQERDFVAFERILEQYCSNNLDPETEDFINYFKENYQKNSKCWAYCYRLHSGLNTNMHLERMHKTIKYIYLAGKKVKRLDKGISALMRFVRDKLVGRLIVLNKGKLCNKIKNIRDRHKNKEQVDPALIVTTEHGWEIPSTNTNEIYFIQEANNSCKCQLRCLECNICIHTYYCSCHDSSIKFNMCKHIHVLAGFRKQIETVNNDFHEDSPQEDELFIECPENDESDAIITQLAKKQKTSSSIEERRQSLLMQFQGILHSGNSHEKLDVIAKVLNSLPPTLAAIDNNNMSFSSCSKNNFQNVKIEPQRRFWSTKKKSKKTACSLRKPSQQESNTIAIQMLSNT